MIDATCDYCGSTRFDLWGEVNDTNYGFEGRFKIQQCSTCSHVFLSPRPSPSEIGRFYPAEYHPFLTLESGIDAVDPVWIERADWLGNLRATHGGTVLDVGCGNGQFLLAMKAIGWKAYGNEFNANIATAVSRNLNIDVRPGPIEMIQFEARFDLITMWDVLEHVASPSQVLSHLHTQLNPGGYIAINVPNWGGLERVWFGKRWIAIDAPRHLHHFTAETLGNFLNDAGFNVVSVNQTAPVQSLASNVLRLFGDLLLRGGRSKTAVERSNPTPPARESTQSQSKSKLIQIAYALLTPINQVTNALGRGANLTILAQKEEV